MRNVRKLWAPVLVTLGLAAGAVAFAAPHGGGCHGHSGHGFDSGMGMMSPHVVEQLQLSPEQEQARLAIATRAKALHEQKRMDRTKLKEAFHAELAKAEPDFAQLSELRGSLRDGKQQAMQELETQQLALYGMLTAEQKATVKKLLLERMEHKHEKHGHDKKEG